MVTPRSVRAKHAAQIRAATPNAWLVPFGVCLRVARAWAPASRVRRDPVPLTMLLFFAVGLTPALHVPRPVDSRTQTATHSNRFPTMSKAPRANTQLLRDPVLTAVLALFVLQSVMPLSGPGSGVPATAACHSAFDGPFAAVEFTDAL